MFVTFLVSIFMFPMMQMYGKKCPSFKQGVDIWMYNQSLKKCYGGPINIRHTFREAELWCRQHGAHLFMPKSPKDWQGIKDVSISLQLNKENVWIGIDDFEKDGIYKWADGRYLFESQLVWGDNQPQRDGDKRQCVSIVPFKKKMFISSCWKTLGFICESPGTEHTRKLQMQRCPVGWTYFDCGDFCYKMSRKKFEWSEKHIICQSKNAKLAMPKTGRQKRSVALMIKLENEETWIGLTKPDSNAPIYEWIDGTLTTPTKWGSSRDGDGKNCLSMNSDGLINVHQCSDKKYVICQKPQKEKSERLSNICGKADKELETGVFAHLRDIHNKKGMPMLPHNIKNIPFIIQRRSIRSKINGGLHLGHIHGGQNIDIESFPWAATILTSVNNHVQMCGGAIIGPRHVLTAAHCLLDKIHSEVKLYFGSMFRINFDRREEDVHVMKIHDQYIKNNMHGNNPAEHDIAIVELERSLPLGCRNIRPICLPNKKKNDFTKYTRCIHVGLGNGSGDSLKYCRTDPNDWTYIRETNIFFPKDKCYTDHGDSGSSLACIDDKSRDPKWTLIGVTQGGTPTIQIFGKVDYYLDWINQVQGLSTNGNELGETRLYSLTACSNKYVNISCSYGRPPAIKVKHAMYGRPSLYRCVNKGTKNADCFSDVTDLISSRCNGRNRCKFHVKKSFLGDPCPKKNKYFEMTYSCVEPEGMFREVQCLEDKPLQLSCGVGNPLVIEVMQATYGKSSSEVCPKHTQTSPECKLTDQVKMAAERCNGKVSCTLKLDGDPCKNVQVYSEISYTCLPEYDKRLLVCPDNPHIAMSCDEFPRHHIQLTTAAYAGQRQQCHGSQAADLDCTLDVTSLMASRCDGRKNYAEPIRWNDFIDPCPHVAKYLEIFYKCVPDEMETVCNDGDQLHIACSTARPGKVNVTHAVFGNSPRRACDSEDSTCKGKDVTSELKKEADGKTEFIKNIDFNSWEDPCPGEKKYLEIYYTCVADHLALLCDDYEMLGISCSNTLQLDISLAFYGRSRKSPCGHVHVNSACVGFDVTSEIKDRCEGKVQCQTQIDFTKTFGETCSDHSKYLEVYYSCRKHVKDEHKRMADAGEGRLSNVLKRREHY